MHCECYKKTGTSAKNPEWVIFCKHTGAVWRHLKVFFAYLNDTPRPTEAVGYFWNTYCP